MPSLMTPLHPAEHYMEMALQQAKNASNNGEVPVGAILVDCDTGNILALTNNRVEELSDPTAHAELLAVRLATTLRSEKWLGNCDLFVTLEPCAMCAGALAHARIRRIVFGAYDPKGGAIAHGGTLFDQPTTHHKPEIIGGVMEQQCADVLKKFFRGKR